MSSIHARSVRSSAVELVKGLREALNASIPLLVNAIMTLCGAAGRREL